MCTFHKKKTYKNMDGSVEIHYHHHKTFKTHTLTVGEGWAITPTFNMVLVT